MMMPAHPPKTPFTVAEDSFTVTEGSFTATDVSVNFTAFFDTHTCCYVQRQARGMQRDVLKAQKQRTQTSANERKKSTCSPIR